MEMTFLKLQETYDLPADTPFTELPLFKVSMNESFDLDTLNGASFAALHHRLRTNPVMA